MIVYANTDYYEIQRLCLQQETMGKTHEVTKNAEGGVDNIRLPIERQIPIEVRKSIP